MVADRAKKSKTASPEIDVQPENDLFVTAEDLQEVQHELIKINEEANEKVFEVEQKYNEIRKPVYARRNEIISSIPDFWLTAFLSHPALGELLNEKDQEIFKYLDSLDVEEFTDFRKGYCITFNFNPNPFFEDTNLIKTINLFEDGSLEATGTAIKWYEGMGPADGINNEKKGNKRPLIEESFFNWFGDSQHENSAELLHDEVAVIIKEELWPNPLKYFNNEADEEDSEENEGDEDEEDADDEDEQEEKDEDGNEEDG